MSFGFTHRIFAITPHLSSCEREPGTSEILARGAIGSGVPRSGDGGGGGGGGSSDLWSASAAQSCQVLLTTRGRRRRDCDGGVAQSMILARTPGLNAVAAAAPSAAGTWAEPWRSLAPIPPLQDTRFPGRRPKRAPAAPGRITHKDSAKLSSSRASIAAAAAASTRRASGPAGLLSRPRPGPSLGSAL